MLEQHARNFLDQHSRNGRGKRYGFSALPQPAPAYSFSARKRAVWLVSFSFTRSSGVPSNSRCPPLSAAFGAEVDQPVGGLDDVHVVLDDEHRVALLDQRVQGREQLVDVVEVQAGAGLVEDEQDLVLLQRGAFGQEGGQLHALGLAARERVGRLPQADVAQAHVVERLEAVGHLGLAVEELHGVVHGQLQHLVDALVLVLDVQDVLLELAAAAGSRRSGRCRP